VKIRAKQLYYEGSLTFEEFVGKGRSSFNVDNVDKELHVHWFSVCTNEREQHYKCEECGKYDPERRSVWLS